MTAVALVAGSSSRLRVTVEGTVQGVGFRPHVYRLARELGLTGFVRNDSSGVVIEVEGTAGAVEDFVGRLRSEAPPLAVLDRVSARPVAVNADRVFQILGSDASGAASAPVTPDTATCDDCLRELRDRLDRRFRYPFINCTNCGPRFTIVGGVPYDRPRTTMADFEMCERCRSEYADPGDRRFHAQPNACPDCGPHVWLTDSSGAVAAERDDAIRAAVRGLRDGAIVALKGLGGFHLACVADDEAAVAALRARKHREEKPFALMAPSLEAARELVELTEREEALLESRERPIVIARRRAGAPAAAAVAPRSRDLGVMLPYSPLHHLLLEDMGVALVMTSGNVSDEPIAYADDDALTRLGGIADLFLLHDRRIETRTDDSIVRATRQRTPPLMIRRSRGYVPAALRLPVPASRPVLACGAELKSTFCVAKGARAWVSHHIGDLEKYETLESFIEGISHFERLFAVTPEVVAHDLHPEYLSTKFAVERHGVDHVAVQHHHAHLAACLAEHGARGPAVGAIYDGTGYGLDGTIWGGELLVGDLVGFERAGSLWPVGLPGGAAAIREPWRMAAAWLTAVGRQKAPAPLAPAVDPSSWRAVCELARTGVASPTTTSMGRLFDAVAALCGLRMRVSYEGQAAAELEAVADPEERGSYPLPLGSEAGRLVLDARETVLALLRDLDAAVPASRIAARFHNAVAFATCCACVKLACGQGVGTVVLGGGTFQNRRLLEAATASLRRAGLRVLVPELLPPNDGGISYGQAAVAAARSEASS